MKIKFYLSLTIITLLVLTSCSNNDIETNTPVESVNNTSSSQDVNDCALMKYNMDCDIAVFLEEELAWVNNDDGRAFCAYEPLGEKDGAYYLQVLCEEYYIQDEQIVCPDEKARQACFNAKDVERQACEDACDVESIEPYLAQGSGVSMPVKISKTGDAYSLWQPRDGSLYAKDIADNFPKEYREKLQDVDGGALQAIVIERAEDYFKTDVKFDVSGEMDTECSRYEDCGMLPMEYAIRSNCPHTVKCLEGECVAGCYDTQDYTRFPVLR